jgi:hypothetical protein
VLVFLSVGINQRLGVGRSVIGIGQRRGLGSSHGKDTDRVGLTLGIHNNWIFKSSQMLDWNCSCFVGHRTKSSEAWDSARKERSKEKNYRSETSFFAHRVAHKETLFALDFILHSLFVRSVLLALDLKVSLIVFYIRTINEL